MSGVLVAGPLDGVAGWLEQRLPGVRVQAVESGRDLLSALSARSWSLLVLDAALPGLSGEDALRSVRVFPEGRSIPVIYCARGRVDASRAQALVARLGVNHLLHHPLDRDELVRHAAAILGVAPLPDEESAPAAQLGAAMGALWEKFRDTIFARVEAVETAAAELREGRLDEERRRAAEREAHKLAGAVGSFGFAEGSRLAREAEELLGGIAPPDAEVAPRLAALASALRTELERPLPGEPSRAAADDRPFLLVVDGDRELADRVAIEAAGRYFRAEVAAGLPQARRAVSRQRPDVVLLDLALDDGPGGGLEFLSELSGREPPIPAVVLAARAEFDDRVEAARRGARGFLPKPVPPAQAMDAVQQAVRERALAETRLLVVDDDPQVLEGVRTLLETRGIRVSTLENPLRFWDTLEESAPDLLVLDLDMPHLGGLELCRVVRNDPRWNGLPVLFLTGSADAATVQRVFAAGADDFVAKPFVGPELVTRIVNRLDRVQLHRTLAETDPLTGLSNRRKSEEVIQHFLRLAARREQPFSLAVVDLDHFKAVNDRAGHATGDEVLRRVARVLLRSFRSEDVVARWGGEEFVIGMFGMEKAAGVQRLEQVLGCVREERFGGWGGEELSVAFSAGIAQFPQDGGELPALYREADQALYRAKEEGRGRVVAAGSADGAPDGVAVDVLLVDDDAALAGLLLHALETRGYRTQWAQDGEAAVRALSGEPPALRARVVLLDSALPGLDGPAVLRALGAAKVLPRTRVVMLGAGAGGAATEETARLGAFDHVARPVSIPLLLQRVRRALGTRRN